ncbi:UNVERIFIED_CONTAM: hypothetical protein ABIC26_000808 [Paenibacillus sp. PvR008]
MCYRTYLLTHWTGMGVVLVLFAVSLVYPDQLVRNTSLYKPGYSLK